MIDAEQFAGLRQLNAALLARDTFHAELQIVPHRQMREQAGFLKHIADRPFVRSQENTFFGVLPDFIVNADEALIGFFQASDAAQAGRLARAGRPEQRGNARPREAQVGTDGEIRVGHLQANFYRRRHDSAPSRSGFAAGIQRQQHQKGKDQHRAGQPVRLQVLHGFDVIEDLH